MDLPRDDQEPQNFSGFGSHSQSTRENTTMDTIQEEGAVGGEITAYDILQQQFNDQRQSLSEVIKLNDKHIMDAMRAQERIEQLEKERDQYRGELAVRRRNDIHNNVVGPIETGRGSTQKEPPSSSTPALQPYLSGPHKPLTRPISCNQTSRNFPPTVSLNQLSSMPTQTNQTPLSISPVEQTPVCQYLQQPPQSTPRMRLSLHKPSGIAILSLEDLLGLQGRAKIILFLSSVERVAFSDEERIGVAIERMSGDLQLDVANKVDTGNIVSWNQLRTYLLDVLGEKGDPERNLKEIQQMEYDGVSDPKLFANVVMGKFGTFMRHFPDHRTPNVLKTIKDMLLEPFPHNTSRLMNGYKGDEVPLEDFVRLLARLKLDGENNTGGLVGAVQTVQRRNTRWCAFCRTGSHNLSVCNRAPPKGSCFDCLQLGHKRGDPSCPNYKQGKNGKD